MSVAAVADPVAEAYDALVGADNPEDGAGEPAEGIFGEEQEDAGDDADGEGEAEVEDAQQEHGDDEETSESEDGEDDREGSDEPLELEDESKVILKDGTETTLGELREGALRRDDYTRKTQELAEQRKELEQQREKIDRFTAAFDDDPVGVLEKLVSVQSQPTHAVAYLLKNLAENGVLDEEFARTFIPEGGTVRRTADQAKEEDRLSKIESQLEQRQAEEKQRLEREETLATFEKQWTSAVDKAGLQFESQEQEQELLREVLQYGVDNEITNIEAAYAAYAWNNDLPRGGEPKQSKPAPKPRNKNKQATGAITRRSSGSGRQVKARPASDEEAVRDAWDEVFGPSN